MKNFLYTYTLYLSLMRLRVRLPLLRKIHYIGGSDILPPPLPSEQEQELIRRLADKDLAARQILVEHNLRLVVYIARKFENSGVGIEDLISIGTIGLIKAVNTFDAAKKIKLATYASRCIENEILMYLRRYSKIRSEVSFDEPLNIDWDGNELLLSDILGTDNDVIYKSLEGELERHLLYASIGKLSPRERIIMQTRFGLYGQEEKTQKEVADMLGISQSYISRLEKRIIRKLQKDILKAE
jgi:RNA polymerase sporulation-specific sigma factor